jgi:lysozyme
MNALYKKLATYGLGGAVALSGAYLVAPWEGENKKNGVHEVYLDVVGIPTACYGQTGKDIKLGKKFTDEQCAEMLAKELIRTDKQLDRVFKVKYQNDYQHAAMISFTYNVGIGNVQTSALARLFNQGKYEQACDQLSRWVYAQKKKFNGLVRRREVEKAWCLGNPPEDVKEFYENETSRQLEKGS